tara:strand:+ start:780 stop:1571 length:792 start_codon:yes stop_codon:yes gene_type:complete
MNKKKILISVIITSFNKERYISKAIESAEKQSYKNLEIIVIDNNSTDNSLNKISKFKNVRLLKNLSKKTGALNQIKSIEIGLKKSKGNIICLLDGDDFFKKNKIKNIVNFFLKNPKCEAVFDIPIIFKKNDSINFSYDKKRIYDQKIWPTTFPTSSISIKKNFLQNCIKNFQKKKFEFLEIDFRLCCLFVIYKENYNILKKSLTFYRQVDDGIMSNYKKFSKIWWLKRSQAFDFFIFIKKKFKKKYSFSFDFYLTKLISKIII